MYNRFLNDVSEIVFFKDLGSSTIFSNKLKNSVSSFFKILHDSGVKIYKYTKGFVHSKVFLSDDIRAVVGTINMDYRSLYLHFENGIYLENNSEIKQIIKDFDETIKDCYKLDDKDVKTGVFKSLWQAILRLLAPLF